MIQLSLLRTSGLMQRRASADCMQAVVGHVAGSFHLQTTIDFTIFAYGLIGVTILECNRLNRTPLGLVIRPYDVQKRLFVVEGQL